jgi:glycosyltransferase involved in cell wall biosynthesis
MMGRRKVAHLITQFNIGGIEHQLVERLRRHPAGFAPVVICNHGVGAYFEPVRALGIEPIVVPYRGLLHPSSAVAVSKLAALFKLLQIDVVHANDFGTSVLGVAAAWMTGTKVIVNRVDVGHLRPGFTAWHRRLEAFAARNADLVCANAEAVREVCIHEEGCKPERVVVLRNGLDLAQFDAKASQAGDPLPREPGDIAVAVVGNLWPVKDHRTLVEAATLLKDRFPKLRFFCAGDGVERAYLEPRIRELGLEGRVVLLGHRTDVPSILARCDAFLLCSTAEGLSNAVIEAMAARLPVVATRVGGNPELLEGKRGLLVPPRNPSAVAAALTTLLADRDEAREMGRRGRAFVEAELTLSRMQDAHEELYLRALGEAPAPSANRPRVAA